MSKHVAPSYDPNSLGRFRSSEGERKYMASYARAIELLPEPTQTLDVKTDFGTVRVYEFLNAAHTTEIPIILFPGRTSGVPMWSENLKDLATQRTLYALDALGDAGLSVQTKPIKNSADQALWIEQTLSQLNLMKVHVVGHSFGGWLAANYAVYYPDRVATLSLLEPVFVFQGLRWQIYIQAIPASLPFLPQRWRDSMLKDISGATTIDHTDPVTQMIADATQYYAVKVPTPNQITHAQLQALPMPVYAAMAEKSALHNSEAAMRTAKTYVKDIAVKIWKGATHSLPMEFPQQLDRELLNFMAIQNRKS